MGYAFYILVYPFTFRHFVSTSLCKQLQILVATKLVVYYSSFFRSIFAMLDKNIDINIIAFSCGVTEQYVNWFMSSKYFTTAQNSREVIQAINNHLSV